MSAFTLMSTLRGRGFALSFANGQLVVRPATALTTADRAAIRRHLSELIAELVNEAQLAVSTKPRTVSATWDANEAHRLMYDADTLVSDLGVSGLHPVVAGAATAVVRAHQERNMMALRAAVAAFVGVVRGLGPHSAAESRAG